MYASPLGGPAGAPPTRLPGTPVDGLYLTATDWSPDGARLTGFLLSDGGRQAGVAVYDVTAQTIEVVSTDDTPASLWLADNRRLVYFAKGGAELVVLDPQTKLRTVVDVQLPGPSANDLFAISPDNRTIYYGAERVEADIWIVERP